MLATHHVQYHAGYAGRAPAEDILESLLMPGEDIVYVASISPGIYWKGFAMLALAVLSLLWSVNLALYFLAISGILLLLEHSTQKYLLLGATNKRVVCRSGIIATDVISLRYGSVESVEVVTPPLGALFGYANVLISGTGQMRFMVPFIADAPLFREAILEVMEEHEAATAAR